MVGNVRMNFGQSSDSYQLNLQKSSGKFGNLWEIAKINKQNRTYPWIRNLSSRVQFVSTCGHVNLLYKHSRRIHIPLQPGYEQRIF